MGSWLSMEQGAKAPALPGNGGAAAEEGTATTVKKPNGASSPVLGNGEQTGFGGNAEAPNTPKNNKNKKPNNAAVNVNKLQKVNVVNGANNKKANNKKPNNAAAANAAVTVNGAANATPTNATAVPVNGAAQGGGRRRKARKSRRKTRKIRK